MSESARLFVTRLYRAKLAPATFARLNPELLQACRLSAKEDGAGQRWCRQKGYRGYTSHASLNDLPWRYPAFADLAKQLDRHAQRFAKELQFDLKGRALTLDSLWINVLAPGGSHGAHIHPLSVLSGTYYVEVPKGAAALKLEDPRLGLMMAAPPRKADADLDQRQFLYLQPEAGTILMWESWLKHEVPPNAAKRDRISISFNYRWGD